MFCNRDLKINFKVIFFFFIYSGCIGAHAAFAELRLEQVIKRAVEYQPTVQAGQYAEMTQQQNEKIAQSSYYPTINAMALASTGFPGSAGATGVAGLMVSPFHKGPTAGLVLEQNVWDFGRTSDSIRLAEKETDLFRKDTLVSALKVGHVAQEAYFLCSRDRSLADVYGRIASESGLVQKEVENFVRVGQRSIVDKYLSISQTEEARTLAEDYKKRFELANQRLAYLIGQKGTEPLCPLLEEQAIQELKPASPSGSLANSPSNSLASVSPLLSLAEAQTAVSQTQKSLAQKDFNPKIVGLASVGWMNDTELGIPMQNYSAAIAVILPLFEGFKTVSQVRKYELRTIQNEKNTDATRFGIDEANLNYDRAIESARLRMTHIKEEVQVAEKGFRLAKKRYSDLQGNLVDLREAIRNLARTSGDLKVALYDFATQSTAKALLNGRWNQTINLSQNRPLQ